MKEFDPTSEAHHPLLIIKAVEPGCTTEIQIEDVLTGRVTRLSTSDDKARDDIDFERAVMAAWRLAWNDYAVRRPPGASRPDGNDWLYGGE